MLLQNLPVDLLSAILKGPLSSSALTLLKCGNRQINLKLYNGGVRELILFDPCSYTTSRWPKSALFFKLDTLSISKLNTPLGSPLLIHNALSSMHPGLRNLTLEFDGAVKAVLDVETSILSRFESLKSLRLYSSDFSLFRPTIESIAKLPPSLTSIDIDSVNSSASWRWRGEIRILRERFPNLSFLRLGETSISDEGLLSFEGSSISDFGNSLDSSALILLAKDKNTENSKEVDSSHTHPSADLQSASSSSHTSLQRHPSPTNSKWPNLKAPADLSHLPISSLSHVLQSLDGWPFGTTVITDLFSETSNWKWPKSLTVMHLGEFDEIDSSSLVTLPPTITDLKIPLSWDQIKHSDWPKSLIKLEVVPNAIDFHFTFSCFPRLPRRLQSLTTNLTFEEDYDEYATSEQPQDYQAFQSLLQQGLDTLSGIDADEWNRIKDLFGYTSPSKKKNQASLDSIRKLADLIDEISSQKRNLIEIEKGQLLGLPLTLTELDLSPTKSNALPGEISAWGALPPFLRSAKIGSFSKLSSLPPSLETLHLTYYSLIRSEATEDLQRVFLLQDPKGLKYLKRLNSFKIFFSEEANAEWGDYPSFSSVLPHDRLETVQIDYKGEVSNQESVFRFTMPSMLRVLRVSVKRELPKPSIWMKWLPQTLRELELDGGCRNLKGESLAFLPPSLTRLKLAIISDFSPSHLLSTSPALVEILVGKVTLEHAYQILTLYNSLTPVVGAWKSKWALLAHSPETKEENRFPMLPPEVWLLGLIRPFSRNHDLGTLKHLVSMVHDLLASHCQLLAVDPRVMVRWSLNK